MATIVVEDGTVVSGANSYITAAELDTYASDRGKTISGTQADLLIQAMDYLEAQPFKGIKYSRDQAVQWPRVDVVVDNYYIDSDEIPQLLKDAQAEIAIAIDEGYSPFARIDRTTKREQVDVIEVEYADGGNANPIVQTINLKLAKLLKGGGSAYSVIRI